MRPESPLLPLLAELGPTAARKRRVGGAGFPAAGCGWVNLKNGASPTQRRKGAETQGLSAARQTGVWTCCRRKRKPTRRAARRVKSDAARDCGSNPKAEGRRPKEGRSPKAETNSHRPRRWVSVFGFRNSAFFRPSKLGGTERRPYPRGLTPRWDAGPSDAVFRWSFPLGPDDHRLSAWGGGSGGVGGAVTVSRQDAGVPAVCSAKSVQTPDPLPL